MLSFPCHHYLSVLIAVLCNPQNGTFLGQNHFEFPIHQAPTLGPWRGERRFYINGCEVDGPHISLVNVVVFHGFAGNDTFTMDSGMGLRAYGGSGDDQIAGGHGYDYIEGGDGNDILKGLEGRDALKGGEGNDTLYGGNELDVLFGGSGADSLYGGAGQDILLGDAGDDYLSGSDDGALDGERDYLRGGLGSDSAADPVILGLIGVSWSEDQIEEVEFRLAPGGWAFPGLVPRLP